MKNYDDLDFYSQIIVDITGCEPKDADEVQDIMRNEIFHSTLDWQTRAEFKRGAKEALIILLAMRKIEEAAGKTLKLGLSAELELETLKGSIGEGAALEFTQVIRDMREGIDLEAILRDPEHAEIPSDERISALFAVSTGLSKLADRSNFGQITKYMTRLAERGHADFASLLLHECVRVKVELCQTKAFIDAVKTGTVIGDLVGNLKAA